MTTTTTSTRPPDPSPRCGILAFNTEEAEPGETVSSVISPRSGDVVGIVSGERAVTASQPWTAALGSLLAGTEQVQFVCGGSLLSSLSVLTSAHCLDQLGANTKVLLGQTDLAKEEGGAQLRDVRASLVHPGWSGSPQHDLAILQLDRPVVLTHTVRPICLPPSDGQHRPQQFGVISGWGRTFSGGPATSHLQTGQVEILPHSDCRHLLPHLAHQDLLCARGLPTARSQLTTDACQVCQCWPLDNPGNYVELQGDSGGPLVTEDDISGLWRLTGVVTAGRGCGDSQNPGLYVSVSHHLDWIKQNIQ